MKIGSQKQRSSAISSSNDRTIIVRGRDLCAQLMGRITFTDHVWLLVTGQIPTEAQRRVLDATLVAIAEHGLVPSVQASRMTLAAAPEALQGAVAAGILGCGSVILGAADGAGRLLEIAKVVGCSGRHVEAAIAIEQVLPQITGKTLVMNVSGAIPAVLLDAGYPLLALKGVPILARTAGLIAHLLEEQERPIGFVLSHAGAAAIDYDGVAPADFVASDK